MEVEGKNFYKSYQFKQGLSRLDFLKQNKGFGLITGDPGTGKSSLLRYFKESLNPNLFKCVYIPLSTLTVLDFYRALCDGLGVEPANRNVAIFKQIQESIFNYATNKNITPIIILDEALRQRICVNYHFEGLNNNEIKDYITSRLSVAGCNEPIFSDDSFEILYSITNGQPRQLNSIARMCLVSAASKCIKTITKEDVFNAHQEISILSN